MNTLRALLLAFTLTCVGVTAHARETGTNADGQRIDIAVEENSADNPCISSQEYAAIEQRMAENCATLGIAARTASNNSVTKLAWPLRAANGLADCDYYRISAHVDHNPASGAVKDFNCGTLTYDGHRGTDISIFPFPFYKMDNDQVEVVAAAAGTIVDKSDGNFDKNCATNSLTANYIVIQHDDGSRILYFHMKKNSLTAKAVGQPVAVGEYLGKVGSSGNSSGPHLHFEVWSGSTVATLNDPFAGQCNALNTESWWTAQKAYKETAVVKASVHTTDIVFPTCPATESPNESTVYHVPFEGPGLSPGYAKFYIFMRNETAGLAADCKILYANKTVFNSWTYNSTADHNSSVWAWSKKLPTTAGMYSFEATYNGTTCAQQFEIIDDASGVVTSSTIPELQVYPNPARGAISIAGATLETGRCRITLRNMLGQIVADESSVSDGSAVSHTVSVVTLPSGVYFLSLETGSNRRNVTVNILQ